MADVGMAPAQALVATTSEAARLLGVDAQLGKSPGRLGSLAPEAGDPPRRRVIPPNL
jgi:imidazolonepropionase-like amidohydrolase